MSCTTTIPPRTLRPWLYSRLRKLGIGRRDCLRVLWHGADLSVEAR